MLSLIIIGVIILLILGTVFDGYYIVRTREAAILDGRPRGFALQDALDRPRAR